jgi:3D (Asp-Asp-Asp) domain-containing protein/septal ring factor EnvC (AmiA/AmiB activator)
VLFAGVAAALFDAATVTTAGARGPGASLRAQASALASQTHRALLDLYSLDTRLHAAQARLATCEGQAAQLRRERAQLSQQLAATHQTLVISQGQLGDRITMLYKEGSVSSLAVVLGSVSLDAAMTRLDDLNRVADQDRQLIDVAASAQSHVHVLRTRLLARSLALASAVSAARREEAALESSRAERVGFIAGLRREQQMKAAQIATIERRAARVERKSEVLQAAAATVAPVTPASPAPVPVSASGAATSGGTITVASTGYSLSGRTATGMPVGWGIVAVDPSVIPLGTRLTIPGYGDAVAADTGGGVHGDMIDIWFPTDAQARAWGRRTITVTLH